MQSCPSVSLSYLKLQIQGPVHDMRPLGTGLNALREQALSCLFMTRPVPKDVGRLRSFLGMANYFKRFVKGYCNLVRLLNSLLRKTAEWQWTANRQQASDKAKETLVYVPVLA